jgi:hypothetical protein
MNRLFKKGVSAAGKATHDEIGGGLSGGAHHLSRRLSALGYDMI